MRCIQLRILGLTVKKQEAWFKKMGFGILNPKENGFSMAAEIIRDLILQI